jgi:hypothetical protein
MDTSIPPLAALKQEGKMTEQEAKMWIEEVTDDFVEIGYTMKEATALAWTKFLEMM